MSANQVNTHILLVSDDMADIASIQIHLEESTKMPCSVCHCPTIDNALEILSDKNIISDLIILDLGLNDISNPKEIYQKISTAADSIPIIVLTGAGREEHNLATFVMDAGASDRIVRGQFSRLSDAVKFSLIRQRISDAAANKGLFDLEEQQSEHELETMEIKRRSDEKNLEKNQYISWVMGSYSVEPPDEAS